MSNPLEMGIGLHVQRETQERRLCKDFEKSSLLRAEKRDIHFPILFNLYLSVRECSVGRRCFMPPNASANFHSYFSTDTFHSSPGGTHYHSVPVELQLHQTSVLKSQRLTDLCFYFSRRPLPLEHLTRFHTSCHQQSRAETQPLCLSPILQNTSIL